MVNDNNNVDDEIISHVFKFEDAFGFSFVVSNDWVFVIDICRKGLKLEVGQTFDCKINWLI
jgi:hypothetical protein